MFLISLLWDRWNSLLHMKAHVVGLLIANVLGTMDVLLAGKYDGDSMQWSLPEYKATLMCFRAAMTWIKPRMRHKPWVIWLGVSAINRDIYGQHCLLVVTTMNRHYCFSKVGMRIREAIPTLYRHSRWLTTQYISSRIETPICSSTPEGLFSIWSPSDICRHKSLLVPSYVSELLTPNCS